MIKQGNVNFVSLVVERFFCDVIEKLEQDSSSIIETIKETFLELIYMTILRKSSCIQKEIIM